MATYKKINVDIGLESDFTKLPAEVTVGGWSYFLARSRKGVYQLLSNVCPHLGCRVHWEAQKNHFMCPCHNGVFDAVGIATAGPPAEAGQRLARYPLKVESGMLFIEVPLAAVS